MKIGEGPKLPPLPGGKPDATKSSGKGVTTFPDVAKTPTPGGAVPIPYPNVGGSDTFERAGSKVPNPLLGGPDALAAPRSPRSQAEVAKQVGGLLGAGQGAAALASWAGGVASSGPHSNVSEMLAGVLKEAVASANEDKKYFLEKLQGHNEAAAAVTDYLAALVDASVALAEKERGTREASSPTVIPRSEPSALEQAAEADRFAGLVTGFATAKEELRALVAEMSASDIRAFEEKLDAVGDDAQLANVDLQNILQKQQQTLQMMSNISKMLYDTAQSVIRKMGG